MEERLERSVGASVTYRPVQAPVDRVFVEGSVDSHTAYRGALRSLCGLVVADAAGELGEPSCPTCAATLDELVEGGFVGDRLRGQAACPASTRKGAPCLRDPIPGRQFCPSHKHLENA